MNNSVPQKHSSFKTAFPISSVWFGALVGPSMVSGVYARVYFAPYGAWGIPLAFIAIAPAAAILALAMNIVRQKKVYDYASFGEVIYGKTHKFMMPIYDIYVMLSMFLGGGAVISMGGTFFNQIFGLSDLLGAILMAILSIAIVIWGAKLIRVTSTAMTVVLVVCFLTMVIFVMGDGAATLGNIMSTWYVPETANLGNGFYKALIIGFSNFGFGSTLCSVSQNVKTKKDCTMFWICSTVLNGCAWALTTAMLLPYCPEILLESVPILYLFERFLTDNFSTLYTVYMLAMFLALLSSGAPQLFAIVPRIKKMLKRFRDPNKTYSDKVDNAVIGVVYFTLTILLSRLGLIAIVSRGYTFAGQLGFCVFGIPVLLWYFWGRKKKDEPIGAQADAPEVEAPSTE